ncbi:hypothetical protein Tco_0038624 [Tanacetum coccineum]
MLDWKPLCIRRKKHFKLSLISSGTLSRRSKTHNLMNSFWATRRALSMLKSLERFWISIQELKVKNSLRYKMMMLPSPSSLTLATKLAKAIEEEAARQVYATLARIVTESVPKPARRRTSGIAFRDTSQVSKKVSFDLSQRLKGSSEGTGRIPGVPNKSIVVSATSSEGNGTKPEVPNKEKVTSEANDNEKKDDANDDKSIDLEMTDDEETDDEFVHRDEKVNDNEDEEMKNAKVEYFGKGDAKISDVAKADVEKIEEIKGDAKKAELSPTSSILSLSLVPTPIPETPLLAPSTTLLPPPSVSTIPYVPHQTTARIPTPPIITDAPTITTAVPESNAVTDVQLRVAKLEKDVSELKKIDHSAEALATLKSQVLTVVEYYLGSKISDDFKKFYRDTL